MSTYKNHILVKYCTVEAAEKILSSQSLRWSSPHVFSDPFELTHESKLNFDPHTLLDETIKIATAMVFAKAAPPGNTPLETAIRRWREEERFTSAEEAEEVLRELLSQLIDQNQKNLDRIMIDWRKFARTLRICCFSATPDNLLAWQQYADNYRGLAIEFNGDKSSSLPKPQQVHYKNVCPEITTLKEQISTITSQTHFVAQEQFYKKFTTKPVAFNPFQEWRCFRQIKDQLNKEASKLSVNEFRFEVEDLNAVYFGINTHPDLRRKFYKFIKTKYKHAKVYQVKPVSSEYKVELELIKK